MSKKPNLYTDVARFYDYDETQQMNLDIPFYREYAQRIGAKSILDLCCGTGRVALQLANEFKLTCVDFSSAMLDVFKEKLGRAGELKKNISIINSNAAFFKSDEKFDLVIIPYRSFQQFANSPDAVNCLKCVHKSLHDGGTFILSCYRPLKDMDERWVYPKKLQWSLELEDGTVINKYHWGERIDTVNQLIYPVLCYEEIRGSTKEVFYEDLTLKYYYHEQLKQMLQACGFEVEQEYGDYQQSPVDKGTEYIFVCKKIDKESIAE